MLCEDVLCGDPLHIGTSQCKHCKLEVPAAKENFDLNQAMMKLHGIHFDLSTRDSTHMS